MKELEFIPYTLIDGIPIFRDSEIKTLYDRTVVAVPVMFQDGQIQNDLDFLAMVKDQRHTVFFTILVYGETLGYFYLNRLEKTHAHCHFMCFPDFWGRSDLVYIGQEALRLCLKTFPMIMGMIATENAHAIKFLKKLGMNDGGTFPYLMYNAIEDKAMEGKILYITQEDLK